MSKSLEEMKAELAAKVAKVQAETAEKMEMSRVQAKLNMLDNEALTNARVATQLRARTTAKLEETETALQTIVAEMPVHNARTKQDRVWNPSRQYGLGNHIAVIAGILTGILYSVQEHKDQMLAYTGLNIDLIESTVEAFGSTAYFNKNYGVIVDEVPYNVDVLKTNLALIAETLDIDLDTSLITEATMSKRFTSARLVAERTKLEEEKASIMKQQVIQMD